MCRASPPGFPQPPRPRRQGRPPPAPASAREALAAPASLTQPSVARAAARHPFLLEQPEDPSPAAGDGQQNTDRGIRPPLATPFSIVARLRAMGYNVDHGLSPRQAGDSVAFASLVEDALAPALEATLWLNEDTYGSVTRRAYDGLFRFPFQFFLPKGIKARCAAVVAGKSEAKLLADADRAMQALSIRLGQAPFFFGDSYVVRLQRPAVGLQWWRSCDTAMEIHLAHRSWRPLADCHPLAAQRTWTRSFLGISVSSSEYETLSTCSLPPVLLLVGQAGPGTFSPMAPHQLPFGADSTALSRLPGTDPPCLACLQSRPPAAASPG